jgi:hypothetical protein
VIYAYWRLGWAVAKAVCSWPSSKYDVFITNFNSLQIATSG